MNLYNDGYNRCMKEYDNIGINYCEEVFELFGATNDTDFVKGYKQAYDELVDKGACHWESE